MDITPGCSALSTYVHGSQHYYIWMVHQAAQHCLHMYTGASIITYGWYTRLLSIVYICTREPALLHMDGTPGCSALSTYVHGSQHYYIWMVHQTAQHCLHMYTGASIITYGWYTRLLSIVYICTREPALLHMDGTPDCSALSTYVHGSQHYYIWMYIRLLSIVYICTREPPLLHMDITPDCSALSTYVHGSQHYYIWMVHQTAQHCLHMYTGASIITYGWYTRLLSIVYICTREPALLHMDSTSDCSALSTYVHGSHHYYIWILHQTAQHCLHMYTGASIITYG